MENFLNERKDAGTFEGFGFELEYTRLSGDNFDIGSPLIPTGEILYMPEGIWYTENGQAPRPDKKWKERVKAFIEETA
jgi:hypothetical protein